MFKKIVIVLVLLGAGIALQAQTFIPYNNQGDKDSRGLIKKETGFSVQSINLIGGLYAPKMDYLNDNYLPNNGCTEEFGAGMLLGGNITFGILSEFRARLGVSYWSDKVANGADFDELKVSFTRFSLGGLYAPKFASFGICQAYTGLEAYVYSIKNEFELSSGSNSEDYTGDDYSFAPLLGLEAHVDSHFVIGAEFSYMLGSYTQLEGLDSNSNDVSIAGPQMTLSLGYKF